MRTMVYTMAVAGLLPISALSATTECPSIDAEAHHSADRTVDATETNGRCTLSVDGANADTQNVPEEASRCVATLFRRGAAGQIAQSSELTAFAFFFLIAPRVPSGASSVDPQNPSFPLVSNPFDRDACLNWLLNVEARQPSDVTQSMLFDDFTDFGSGLGRDIADCIATGSSSGSVQCARRDHNRLSIRFSTSFAEHHVTILAP